MVKVLKPGLYSTVQDFGRTGYQEFGVPYSGTMDHYAAKIVNMLLGNDENAAVIEMTMTGASLQFECDTLISISGANMSPELNKKKIPINKAVAVKQGDVLSFGKLQSGFRSYLGILSGFKTEKILNSRSMYVPITHAQVLKKGEILPVENLPFGHSRKHAQIKIDKSYLSSETLEVFKGPEFDRLTITQQKTLLKTKFSISKDNNRMAYQLEGRFENKLDPIITSAVMPGTVQLTPSGKLIILMRDCQTTGGYPRVLQLADNALNVMAQKFTGQTVSFMMLL
ncbi:biotin-dependent carboxyltransferase family protein [Tamlana crocina]